MDVKDYLMSQKPDTPVLLADAIEFHRIKYKVELNRLELGKSLTFK